MALWENIKIDELAAGPARGSRKTLGARRMKEQKESIEVRSGAPAALAAGGRLSRHVANLLSKL